MIVSKIAAPSMQGAQVRTKISDQSIKKITDITKKEVLDMPELIGSPSKDLLSKPNYMNSEEFLQDPHNIKMFNLIDEFINFRDRITDFVTNNIHKEKLAQGINGHARIKKHLDINPKMNFSQIISFPNREEFQYDITRAKLHNQSRKFLSTINR